jgi:hypothetical protein
MSSDLRGTPGRFVPLNRDGSDLTPEQVAEREAAAEKRKKEQEEWREKQAYQRLHAVELSIAELRKEAAEKTVEAAKLEGLFKDFPDLLKHVNRWQRVRYYSKSVNPRVTDYDCSHNCGCCSDSPLEVWPYLETENGKVYSDPVCFTVGEKAHMGDRPYAGWKEKMREAHTPESIIERIQQHFKDEEEKAREELDSSFSEVDPEDSGPDPIF